MVNNEFLLQQVLDCLGDFKYRKDGSVVSALCPFHPEQHPSFYLDVVKGVWHCFGCGRGGSLFSFFRELGKEDIIAGVYLNKQDELEGFFSSLPSVLRVTNILNFLRQDRGIKPEVLERIDARWCERADNSFSTFSQRVIFPCRTKDRIHTILGYAITKENGKKYLFPSGRPLLLPFGLWESQDWILEAGKVFVVEGVFDMLSLWQVGVPAIAAAGGASVRFPVILPQTVGIYLLPDNDSAGYKLAAAWGISLLMAKRYDVNVAWFPSGIVKDANDALRMGNLNKLLGEIKTASIIPYLLHASLSANYVDIGTVMQLLLECLPLDYYLRWLSWARRRYPNKMIYPTPVCFPPQIQHLAKGLREIWIILLEAAKSREGKDIINRYLLEAETPFLYKIPISREKCIYDAYTIRRAVSHFAYILRSRIFYHQKEELLSLGVVETEDVVIPQDFTVA